MRPSRLTYAARVTRGRRARWRWALFPGLAAVGAALLLRPAGPLFLPASPGQPSLWRGAYHVHSTHSDGSGSPEAIARAAASAGLDFVVLTDHGDATRPPATPRHVEGVLLLDGVEISTEDGHYVALGLPQAPYPLAGEARAVAEDVRRLGGIGILAHPDSPRQALAWHDWSVNADGYEWVNADTTWRSAGVRELLARLVAYPLNRAGALAALASYPEALIAERDSPARAPQIALAAVDAHARIGWTRGADPIEGGRTLARFPSYAAMFGTFGLVVPREDATPDPARQAAAILDAIRDGRASSAVFSMAPTPWVALDISNADTLLVQSNASAGAVIRVRRNGRPWREGAGPTLRETLPAAEGAAIYRAEVWLPARRGWPALPVAVSGARAHNQLPFGSAGSAVPGATPDRVGSARPLAATGWHVEHDPASSVVPGPAVGGFVAQATMTLAPGTRRSQFAALVADLGDRPPDATGLTLDLSADGPMRLSVQLREPRPGEGLRWRHSAYLDTTRRVVDLPLDAFRPIPPASGGVPLDRLHALLLVVDTVNARPGDRRTVTLHAASWTTDR